MDLTCQQIYRTVENGETDQETQIIFKEQPCSNAQRVGLLPALGGGDCRTVHRCQRDDQPSVRAGRPLGLDGGCRASGIRAGHAGLPTSVGVTSKV